MGNPISVNISSTGEASEVYEAGQSQSSTTEHSQQVTPYQHIGKQTSTVYVSAEGIREETGSPYSSYSQSEGISDAIANGDWLATATNDFGRPIAEHEIDENSMITIGGIQAPVKSWANARMMSKVNGQWRINDAAGNAQQQESSRSQPQAHQQEQQIPLNQQLANKVGHSDLSRALDCMQTGEMLKEEDISRMASTLGLSEEQTVGWLLSTNQRMNEEHINATKAFGHPAAIAAFAKKEYPREYKEALFKHAVSGDSKVYKQFAKAYLAELPERNPKAALSAILPNGAKAFTDNKGKIAIRLNNGQSIGWKDAVRSGLFG